MMKQFQELLFRALFAVLFISSAITAFAQTAISVQEYTITINSLADELKSKLEKIQRSNNRNATWRAAEYALEDLNNVRKFYLKPNCLSLNWDTETTRAGNEIISVRPYEKPSHREPNYKKQYLVKIINNDGKGLYIKGYQPNINPTKYLETSSVSFYDPAGRKIKCRGKLLTFEKLRDLIKTSQLEVLYGRESRPFLDVTGSSTNGGVGAAYDNVPYGWLLKSSYTNEMVQLPFGTFWTRTADNNGGYKCITVDVMAAHDYEETVLNKSEKAFSLYAVEIDYSQLLQWYKESLDYIMRDVNKLIGEQENKIAVHENVLREAENLETLPKILTQTANFIRNSKDLFDYEVEIKGNEIEIKALANKNTIALYESFWKQLRELEKTNGNVTIWNRIPNNDGVNVYKQVNHTFAYTATDIDHIYSLIESIRKACDDNVRDFMNTILTTNDKRDWKSVNISTSAYNNPFYLGVKMKNREPGERIPFLAYKPSKGNLMFGASINKSEIKLSDNISRCGYTVKVRK